MRRLRKSKPYRMTRIAMSALLLGLVVLAAVAG